MYTFIILLPHCFIFFLLLVLKYTDIFILHTTVLHGSWYCFIAVLTFIILFIASVKPLLRCLNIYILLL